MHRVKIRNVAIIAHVDHGKTTLVDQIIKQARILRDNELFQECLLDSNELERERGITIYSKNISVVYKGVKINIIDTPGHSDFGGQVERVLKLADGVLLLVDAAEGPMPQTRFVLDKALALDLKPIVVINKVDKPDARCDTVHEMVFDLFAELGAGNDQMDFPLLYASGRDGWAVTDMRNVRDSIQPLMDAMLDHIPAPRRNPGPVQMQVMTLDYSDYVGRIGIGRVYRGTLDLKTMLCVIKRDGSVRSVRIKELYTFEGLGRTLAELIPCGDLCAVSGIPDIDIGDTVAAAGSPEALPLIALDEPTLSMMLRVNDSPFFGREGKFVTSRHLHERLVKETERDVALRVQEQEDAFDVSGRGVLHLSILIETMRREGFELTVTRPRVIERMHDGVREEPIEVMTVDVPEAYAGKVIELAGQRRGEMVHADTHGDRKLLSFHIPTRGLIGLRGKVMTATAGEAIVTHRFIHYAPWAGAISHRNNGVLVSMGNGKALPFAIDGLRQRGAFFIEPGEECYEGMIVGEHCLDSDLPVNVQRAKQLTNIRAAGSDRNLKITPARKLTLEEALEFIRDDEWVEVTPRNIRLRKQYLKEHERKRRKRIPLCPVC